MRRSIYNLKDIFILENQDKSKMQLCFIENNCVYNFTTKKKLDISVSEHKNNIICLSDGRCLKNIFYGDEVKKTNFYLKIMPKCIISEKDIFASYDSLILYEKKCNKNLKIKNLFNFQK